MKHHGAMCAVATLLLFPASIALGQGGPSVGGPSNYNPAGAGTSSRSQDQSDADRAFREAISQKRNALSKKESREQVMQEAGTVAKSLHLACDVSDAQIASENKITGKTGAKITARTYEIACGQGEGFFVVAQDPDPPVGFSCFAIEGQRAAAAAKGEKFDQACVLAANHDLNMMATAVLSHVGTTCNVAKLQWYGQNSSMEFTEVACGDGKGYLVGTALPGSDVATRAVSCTDAAAQGKPCIMTKSAPVSATAAPAGEPAPTLEAFKAALTQHGIACTPSGDNDIRLVGKQNKSQRHVVEFKCPEQPKGLVALIPLGSNTNPFQSMNCAEAAKIGASCKLTTAN
jgi:hypothetical protein